MLILMSICLLASPDSCREERLSFSFQEAGFMVCMVRSQEAIAEWQASHPQWRIDKWRCVNRNAVPNDI